MTGVAGADEIEDLKRLLRRPRLLLVEDDRELSGLLAGLLDDEQYAVTLPATGSRGSTSG
jgi:hypothetical protein